MTRELEVRFLGRSRYGHVLGLQRELQRRVRDGAAGDTLLLTEHEPVITLGRAHTEPSLRVPLEQVAATGVELVQIERGGDITYHGPGQLVAYAIVDLRAAGIGVVDIVNGLEGAAITLLAEYGIAGGRNVCGRGVWVDRRKLASVGVNVRGGVTMHGIAINVGNELSGFELINPCGDPSTEMTSIAKELGVDVDLDETMQRFATCFAHQFGFELATKG
jgi:lipoyl(octanoyl) transferase